MQKTKHIALLLFPGFSALCLANAVEPLRAANSLARQRLYSWSFLGLQQDTIQSSSTMPVETQALSGQTGDYLFVMPSYGHLDHDTPQARRALRAAANRFGTLVGLDTGSWLLAAAGLLDGHTVTSHWDVLDTLEETFPDLTVSRARFVIDGNRASCGGATTTLDLMLALIEHHHGAPLALEVAALFMYGERDPRTDPDRRLPDHQAIRAAAALMRRNVEAPLRIGEIATTLGMGQRALELAFKSQTGQTPARLYRTIRLAEARRRIEQTRDSIAEIATRAGYADAAAMTRAFRAEFGETPTALRRKPSQ